MNKNANLIIKILKTIENSKKKFIIKNMLSENNVKFK